MTRPRTRLVLLVAVLATVFIRAVVTDRPMPGWGQSKFPWFYFESFTYVAVLLPIALLVRWMIDRRPSARR